MAANEMQAWRRWGDKKTKQIEDQNGEGPALGETDTPWGGSEGEWSPVVVIKSPLCDTDTSPGRSSLARWDNS
ncbi:hypothetical protein N7490_007964 [Penicillium lividum]|nr:hypothetical protein N7490_007964 [Penicillium lividum]